MTHILSIEEQLARREAQILEVERFLARCLGDGPETEWKTALDLAKMLEEVRQLERQDTPQPSAPERSPVALEALNSDPIYGIVWKTSPDTVRSDCLCSICLQPIGETHAPILRIFEKETNVEGRYHHECIPEELGMRQGYLDAEKRAREEVEFYAGD